MKIKRCYRKILIEIFRGFMEWKNKNIIINSIMKMLIIFFIFNGFLGCSANKYKQLRNGNIISPDNIEYVFLANEGKYIIFGERTFISHIKWQPKKLRHLNGKTDTGVYSCNHDPDLAILYRIKYNSEWSEIYIKKELAGNNYSFENCNAFKFLDTKSMFTGYYQANIEYLEDVIGINNDIDIKNFIEEIKKNEIFTDERYYFLKNPFDLTAGDNGFIGYIYGFFQNVPNLAFPGTIWINNDGLYYLVMDNRLFNINIDWLKKLGYNKL
jgi:hypothetical protein